MRDSIGCRKRRDMERTMPLHRSLGTISGLACDNTIPAWARKRLEKVEEEIRGALVQLTLHREQSREGDYK